MKEFISGVLISAVVLGLAGTAAATIGKRTVEAEYSDIKIQLNGAAVTPKDANGNAVEPFAVAGTTYLPVRAVAGALGLNVEWDATTSTAVLTDNEVDYKPLYLEALTGMDTYKSIENCAEMGQSLSRSLSSEVTYSISPSADVNDVISYLSQKVNDEIPYFKNSISELSTLVDDLRATSKTGYLRDSLADAATCCEKLKDGETKLELAYAYALTFLNNQTEANFITYMTYRNAADDSLHDAIEGALHYYDIRDDLISLLSE